jgi:hypothetical protein
MKRATLILLLAITICSQIFSVHADSVSIQPDEAASTDAVIGSKNPATNWGNWIGLNVGEQDNEVDTGRSLIKFAVPPGITSASLVLYQWSENSSNPTTLYVYQITQDWNETTVTWNNQPAIGALLGSRTFTANEPNGEKVFVLDADLLQQSPYGIEVRASGEYNDLYRFYSASVAESSQRPKLVVEFGGQPTSTPTQTPTLTPSPTPTPYPTPTPLVSNFIIPLQQQGMLHIYVFFGQSNASGRGAGTGCANSNELIYNFGNDYRWGVLCEPSDNSINQVDLVSIDSAGYSAALSFARAVRDQHPDWAIGMLNCARGATSLSQWQRALADDMLYGQCRKRALAASAQGEISGFVFVQGESDAQSLADATQWANRFEVLIDSLHDDFGNVPVVFSQLGNHADDAIYPYWSVVKAQQSSVDLPNVHMIATNDLPMNGLHYFKVGYDTIGQRLAEAMLVP